MNEPQTVTIDRVHALLRADSHATLRLAEARVDIVDVGESDAEAYRVRWK